MTMASDHTGKAMSTTHFSLPNEAGRSFPANINATSEEEDRRPLHQLSRVREREGVSLRAMARRLGTDVQTVRRQENQSSDLLLSELYEWQDALGVPASELLEDSNSMADPIRHRAQMIRLMKTVAAIQERARQPAIQRMAQMMHEQMLELMPELEEVTAWNAVGHRRNANELGAAADRCLGNDLFDRFD